MSYTPERFFCDFCTNELHRGAKRVTIEVPLTLAERKQLAEEFDRGVGPRPMAIFGNLIPTVQMITSTYTVVACLPCFNTILPDAQAMRKIKVAEKITEIQDARARQQQADAEDVEG